LGLVFSYFQRNWNNTVVEFFYHMKRTEKVLGFQFLYYSASPIIQGLSVVVERFSENADFAHIIQSMDEMPRQTNPFDLYEQLIERFPGTKEESVIADLTVITYFSYGFNSIFFRFAMKQKFQHFSNWFLLHFNIYNLIVLEILI